MDEKIIQKIIESNLDKNKEYSFKFRLDDQKEWDIFFKNLKVSLVNYSNQELNYQLLHRKEKNIYEKEYSFIFFKKSKAIVIMPFTISKILTKKEYEISSHGLPMLAPIFSDNISLQEKKNFIETIFKIIKDLSDHLNIKKIIGCENFLDKDGISDWYLFIKKMSFKIESINEGYIDLTRSFEEIELSLRKKKILYDVNKAKNLWNTSIKYKLSVDEWLEFKDLHKSVSGKKTRSDKTWESQFQDINNGNAFVIFIYNNKKIIGGAMYRFSNSMALYAIGAYDRSLYPKPISHLAHYLAINELKKNNFKWLKMGEIPNIEDYNNPSPKEVSIGLFKKKFSSHIFTKKIYNFIFK